MKQPVKSCGLCCTKINGITVTKGKKQILVDVNLHIHCGEITAIIGPNGAGKTTLLKAILGLIKHSGNMNFLDAKGDHTGKPVIGYVPQEISFDKDLPTSVMDLFLANLSKMPLWLYKPMHSKVNIKEVLKIVQADHLINRKIGELSGGELQRILLAFALNPLPDLLLLDEPVSGIDEKGLTIFFDILSDLKKNYDLSIVLISHDLELVARYADRIVFLNKKIYSIGKPEEVYNSVEFQQVFGNIWAKGLFNRKEQ
jgi:zinc transport system ATP-binding protein